MKTSNVRCTLLTALTALAVATMTQVSFAAGSESPITLQVRDPQGNAFQLVYVEGDGWRYGAKPDRAHHSLFRKIAFRSTPSAPAPKDAVQNDEPLTVFLDGPTGFTYVWNRDGGWKFVGTLAAGKL